MNINSNILLIGKPKYTLTVVTSPSNAACSIYADGFSYSAKSITLDAGTYVTVTVSYSNTTSKTYSLTLNKNTTLTFTRTYSTSTSSAAWEQPTLTENGVLGSGSFAVKGVVKTGGDYGPAYKCTCPNRGTTGFNCMFSYKGYVTLWFDPAVKISTITIRNCNGNSAGTRAMTKGSFGYSNDNSSYTDSSFTNSVTKGSAEWDLAVNMPGYYHYFRLTCTAANGGGTYSQYCINRMLINAVYQTTVYNYYFIVGVS